MNPVVTGSIHEYTVLGLFCQAKAHQPWLGHETGPPPSGVSKEQWLGLRVSIFEGYYLRSRFFSFVCIVSSLVAFGLANGLFFEPAQKNGAGEATRTAALVLYVALLVLFFVARLSLDGMWHKAHVQQAVRTWQARFRASGWDMCLEIQGQVFFVVGILKLSASPYRSPSMIQHSVV